MGNWKIEIGEARKGREVLELPELNAEFLCGKYRNFRKSLQSRGVKMPIVANDKIGGCCHSAIEEFIIVGVLFYDLKTIIRLDLFNKGMYCKKLHHILCYCRAIFT